MGAGRCFGGFEESSKARLLFRSRGCGSRDVYLWRGHPAFEPTKRRTAQLFYLSVHGSEWPGGERTNDAFCAFAMCRQPALEIEETRSGRAPLKRFERNSLEAGKGY